RTCTWTAATTSWGSESRAVGAGISLRCVRSGRPAQGLARAPALLAASLFADGAPVVLRRGALPPARPLVPVTRDRRRHVPAAQAERDGGGQRRRADDRDERDQHDVLRNRELLERHEDGQ